VLLHKKYYPSDLFFILLACKSDDAEELLIMQTKELQNERVVMLAAAGCLTQELKTS
jgi:hypothetical protein